jgi:RNA polymerase subunit RPABC4/transcription elongation factor Spt4
MKKKECPSCAMEIDEKSKVCPICGYEFSIYSPWIKWVAIFLIVLFFLMYFIF